MPTWVIIIAVAVFAFLFRVLPGLRRGTDKPAKRTGAVSAIVTAVALVAVGVMFYLGEKPPTIRTQAQEVQITGMYGRSIPISDIEGISLIEKSMNQISPGMHRDNGFGGITVLKGYFSAGNLGKFMLYVAADVSPTIWIDRKEDIDVYISLADAEQTKALFGELLSAIPQK